MQYLKGSTNSQGFLAESAQHFLLSDNLSSYATGQQDDADGLTAALEDHWRLLKRGTDMRKDACGEGGYLLNAY